MLLKFRNFFPGTYQEVMPAILPFFHIYGLNALVLPRLTFGGKIVTIPKFVPELFLNVLEKSKVIYFLPNKSLLLEFLSKIHSGWK